MIGNRWTSGGGGDGERRRGRQTDKKRDRQTVRERQTRDARSKRPFKQNSSIFWTFFHFHQFFNFFCLSTTRYIYNGRTAVVTVFIVFFCFVVDIFCTWYHIRSVRYLTYELQHIMSYVRIRLAYSSSTAAVPRTAVQQTDGQQGVPSPPIILCHTVLYC